MLPSARHRTKQPNQLSFDVRHPEQFSLIGKLRAQYPVVALCHVLGVHRSSYKYWGKAPKSFKIGRRLAGRLMKELGLVSCQQPTHRYKHGGHEHIIISNHLEGTVRSDRT